jgi:eukaryotic-like serine/threonine-protein kinase
VRPELDDTLAAPESGRDRTVTASPDAAFVAAAGLPAGKQLGHFRIERQLGAGGMGEVYLATDLALDRPVAIKVLPDGVARDPKRRERMIREARAQARVVHANVAHMYFIGEDDGRLYFAMEYVSGATLADRIAKGPMPPDDALAVIRAAVLGLREAQRSGFTHRDVKPSNLMIDGHGVVKVLDFGLAAGGGEAPTVAGPVAQTSLAGTPLYMAPEQARGEAVDFRTDIYALGATLYHLVSGKPPFEAESVEQLVSLHATAARPSVPRGPRRALGAIRAIDALCTRMMAARPEDRFASYDDLLRAIDLASIAHTRPAGFWARNVARLLDLILISIVVALGESIIALLAGGPLEDGPAWVVTFALYDTIAVARWGKTIGKSLIELEVLDTATGTRPTLGRCLARASLMFSLPLVLGIAELAVVMLEVAPVPRDVWGLAVVAWVVLGVLDLLIASARASGKRALWDRLTRTMVRYRAVRTSLADT